ncbi:hypothetical protein JJL45_05105 [Tamlana sp. s12]|uniref:hypothetical protein n=1 Tax=Tamlana sp. s12 TaxID=1630406 RepID=UPI0007FF5C55|nr:hypothetical protein [Tamlana sp. s12]OBQ56117.1 hypothetical protein VQ01_06950 [Tamlana sp. s12]QQY83369.1 hypothetical protein JJL45_05105 [Tamlana sp. s12]
MNSLESFKKKQVLISKYYEKIKILKIQRNETNAQLKIVQKRFEELINTDADVDQLALFENLDEYLLD